ncbi:MAG: pseudouridylate synthase [Bacteroidales bacterium]|jgi:predicted hotdog family 3-hydroxylacyl-ACP dehydratase|nr:pseudouridylate synthase [Bacteroidales bacterium]
MKSIDIAKLIPQRPPFVMVDCLTAFEGVSASSELTVKQGNLFVENGMLTEAGIVEHIAQTCAARMGYLHRYIEHTPVKIGFIGEIRNLEIEKKPRVSCTLSTTVRLVAEALSAFLFTAETSCNNESVASCTMKLFITDING